ncbi:MAG: PadR family transcriptional regulator [Tumebacillaceae bacterium]
MALRYAVLGLLSREELSGYDLTQRFAETVSHFWNAHHTQIYRELQKLEGDGLVSHQVIEQQERPDKKVYRITETGMEALFRWLSEEPKMPKMKNESLLRVSLFHLIPPAQAIHFLQGSSVVHTHILGQMEKLRSGYLDENNHPKPDLIGEYLTLEYGIRFMKSWIDWCDFAAQVFRDQQARAESDS